MGCTVILENERMIHRDIRSSLFEVSYRITPRGHYIAQQLVGIRHGSAGAVNESCLYFRPRVDKPRTIALSQLSVTVPSTIALSQVQRCSVQHTCKNKLV